MKRLAALLLLVAVSGCSANTREFEQKNGVCYRTEDHKVFGIKVSSDEVQSVAANCRGE